MWSFLKSAGKWLLIALGVYVASTWFGGLDIESRMGWFIFGLAMAIAYVDGMQKDRMVALESRIADLEHQLNGKRRYL